MSTPTAATAALTIEQREAQLSEAQRKLAAQQAQLRAEREERAVRIAAAQREAEARVLEGVESVIREHRMEQINAEQQLNSVAGADVLDLQQLLAAFDTAANAAAALRGYQQAAHDALSAAGMDAGVAADGTGGVTTITRQALAPDASGKLVLAYDGSGEPVMETVTVRPRPADHEGIPFSQYLDRVLIQRQRLAQNAGSDHLAQSLTEARQTAAQTI
jgi:hypothetical protein